MITYQEEPWSRVWPELEPMWKAHWEETEAGDGIELDVNVEAFAELAFRRQLLVVTARDESGQVVGYHVSVVLPALHNRGTLMAYVDGYYVRPENRKGLMAVKLFREVEKRLKERGVVKIFGGTKLVKDMSRLFQFLGWTEAERTWSKLLGRT